MTWPLRVRGCTLLQLIIIIIIIIIIIVRLYTVAVDYHGQLKRTPPRADNLAAALTVHA